MKRSTVILFSLLIALLLAGLCSCKQEVPAEKHGIINAGVSGVSIPTWKKNKSGLQNLPKAVTSGTGTGVSASLVSGLKNPPELKKAKNLIVLVCEGLTPELMESSVAGYGELIMNSLPVKGTTLSRFRSDEGTVLLDHMMADLYKNSSGLVAWGDISCYSMRRITSDKTNEAASIDVCHDYIVTERPMLLLMGLGDISGVDSVEKVNFIHKAGAAITDTLAESIKYCNYEPDNSSGSDDEEEGGSAHDEYASAYLYSIFDSEETLPSFRQETAFALTLLQRRMDSDGFCLFASYNPSSGLDEVGVQDFDEGVAIAVKYVLENPDTALLVCGCPADGSEEQVCLFGFGKDVSEKETFYECASSLF